MVVSMRSRTGHAVVAMEGVAIRRGGRPVLRGVSLTIRPETVTLVAGPNGAGKSSLLRVIAGVATSARGAVRRDGGGCAFVPERVALAPALRARAWLDAMDGVRGARRAWTAVAGRWELGSDVLDGPVGRLSKGTLQRLVLAEALTAPAGLLVLDEPWAGLDAGARPLLGETLRRRADEGAAVVVTDHSGAGEATVTPDARLLVAEGAVTAHAVDGRVPAVVILARDPGTGAVTRHVAEDGRQDVVLRRLLDAGHSIEEVRRT
jgi:ABC-type multidrug transport system ATPase subunit